MRLENDRLRKENLTLQILANKDVMGKVMEHVKTPPPPPPTILSGLVSYIRNFEGYGIEYFTTKSSYQEYVNEFKENSHNFTNVDDFKEALEHLENRVFKIYDYQHGLHNAEDLAHHILIIDLKDTFDRIKNDHRDWWDSLSLGEYGDTDWWVKWLTDYC